MNMATYASQPLSAKLIVDRRSRPLCSSVSTRFLRPRRSPRSPQIRRRTSSIKITILTKDYRSVDNTEPQERKEIFDGFVARSDGCIQTSRTRFLFPVRQHLKVAERSDSLAQTRPVMPLHGLYITSFDAVMYGKRRLARYED